MNSLLFPDINVWLALSSADHRHFAVAWDWYQSLPEQDPLFFCRLTQLGYLRLLTTEAVMGPGTLTQAQAWKTYDRWGREAGVLFAEEPADLEEVFRSYCVAEKASPKQWADGYLAAFAENSGMRLVTFDRALAAKARGAILLAGS